MMPAKPPPLLVIVGPTAVGKTALSLEIGRRFDGEIISADSRLFYRGMDIGTAKPTPAEQAAIPHHLIDICNPNQTLSLGEYQDLALAAIKNCHQRGKLPILIGGTGQYVMAIVEGWGIPRVPPQPKLRHALEKLGGAELGRWLTQLDPITAEKIDFRNVRRVIRALEVTLTTGIPISTLQIKRPPPFDMKIIGLSRERDDLYQRIDRRVDHMIAAGLPDEVEQLVKDGYTFQMSAMSGLGYRQFAPFFSGESNLEEVTERIKFETHRFARQQHTWFRPDDTRIDWFQAAKPDSINQIMKLLSGWLS
ncbi:MAG: tRNA (adenosine(37)-N6)-dimethylallyltransferase MiaA [Ardenticatenaceae bacterium]|nr:tRNA (adenosine(37)-N6)-dimethylallyltransferase MiaA [Ardenticatenaceae bacterium]